MAAAIKVLAESLAVDSRFRERFQGEVETLKRLRHKNIVTLQGYGEEAGGPLVADPDVDLISFTGSTRVGRSIAVSCAPRLAKVSLELGGRDPFVVCDDAHLAGAVSWAALSAFSNAGQRCAAGSRLIVFDGVYDRFRDGLVERTRRLRVGPGDDDDLGPVISERQLANMLGVRREEKVFTAAAAMRHQS